MGIAKNHPYFEKAGEAHCVLLLGRPVECGLMCHRFHQEIRLQLFLQVSLGEQLVELANHIGRVNAALYIKSQGNFLWDRSLPWASATLILSKAGSCWLGILRKGEVPDTKSNFMKNMACVLIAFIFFSHRNLAVMVY